MHATKAELRNEMRDLRRALDPGEAARCALAAASFVLDLPEVRAARRVALYAATRCELDTAPIAAGLLARGVACSYPRIVAGKTELSFADAHVAALAPGAFGILSPPDGAPEVPADGIDVFVIPGLAFDLAGGRLGWGRGHYDRTLAAAPAALRVGYAYGFQIVDKVPTHAADEAMDVVVTDAGARRTARTPLRRLR